MFAKVLGGGLVGNALKKAKAAATPQQMDSSKLTQAQWAEYQKYNAPSVAQLGEQSNDTSLVDAATKRANSLHDINRQQVDRVVGRRVTSMTPAQRRSIRDRLSESSATDGTSSVYNARIAQRDVNNAAVNSAVDIAAVMNNQALGALTTADQLKASRDAQNAANARAAKGGFLSTLGTLAGAGIGFMAGGPAGASLGASLGGSAGSLFG